MAPPLDVTLEAITFSVLATNPGDVSKFALLGPFTINVTPPSAPAPPSADGGSGPYSADDDPATFDPAAMLTAPAAFEQAQGGSPAPSASTTLLLPNGRGQIQLPSDVTPALSTFTYTETDTPSAPVGQLVFMGLDFTLNAIDAVSGAAVLSLTDSPFATIVLQDSDLKSARIRDLSTLGLYLVERHGVGEPVPVRRLRVSTPTHTRCPFLSNTSASTCLPRCCRRLRR